MTGVHRIDYTGKYSTRRSRRVNHDNTVNSKWLTVKLRLIKTLMWNDWNNCTQKEQTRKNKYGVHSTNKNANIHTKWKYIYRTQQTAKQNMTLLCSFTAL